MTKANAQKVAANQNKEDSGKLVMSLPDGMTNNEAMAAIAVNPSVQAAFTIRKFENEGIDLSCTVRALQKQIEAVQGGDMKHAESLLVSQANTLSEIFNNLARRSHDNMIAGYGEAAERYMKLALRAQNQCKATVEALSAIKNPPVIYAKQANFANGPQQVNNGAMTPSEPMAKDVTHTQGTTIEQNKLSGDNYGILPDTRASQAASRINQEVEAVGKIYRAED